MNAILKIYDALLHSGINEENARIISESISEIKQDERLRDIEKRLRAVEAGLERVKAEIKMQRWVLGLVFAMVAALFVRTFF